MVGKWAVVWRPYGALAGGWRLSKEHAHALLSKASVTILSLFCELDQAWAAPSLLLKNSLVKLQIADREGDRESKTTHNETDPIRGVVLQSRYLY